MVRFFRSFAVVLMSAVALAPFGAAGAADTPGPSPIAACVAPFYATASPGNPNVVIVRAIDHTGPLSGTITAYGAATMWTGKIERAALRELRYGGEEASINVRADGPIEGIAYAPAWASCSFHARVLPRREYEAPDVDRPTLMVGNPQPAEPATCAHPYLGAVVKHAIEPDSPPSRDVGNVRVAVALDERGFVRYTRVVSSPAESLNPSAVDAARRSEYGPAIFRCKPVPSGYLFSVQYVP